MANIEVSTKTEPHRSGNAIKCIYRYFKSNFTKYGFAHIMKELNTSENTAQWLVTGFMLVNGTMIPLTAYLMDRIKTKPLYLVSMGIFLVGSIVAAIAPSFGVLMFARVIQAIGAGIIMPLMQFTLFTLFSKRNVDLQWIGWFGHTICSSNRSYVFWVNY